MSELLNLNEKINVTGSKLNELRSLINIKEIKVPFFQLLTMKFLCLGHQHMFIVADDVKWEEISISGIQILDKLKTAFSLLEELNPKLRGVFTADYVSKINEDILFKLVVLIDKYAPETFIPDFMWMYTEKLMRMFVNEGKKGDLFTPDELGSLLIGLLQPNRTVYDGTSGISDLLIKAKQFNGKVTLYGQEVNEELWIISKLNFILHGYSTDEADVLLGNTLTDPLWLEDHELKKFDFVVMNPPFGLRDWGHEYVGPDKYRRFDYGMPGKAHADVAFIMHLMASLNENGKGGIIVPHGVLFRGGLEQKVRQGIVKDDLLEAIISLPSNLFYGTGIPVVILIYNKNKTAKRRGYVQFINAESGFEKRRTINILREQDIQRILDAYHEMEEAELFSRLVPVDEIHKNDDRWTPSLYFQTVNVTTHIGTFNVDRKQYEGHPHKRIALEEIAQVYRGINPPSKRPSGDAIKFKFIQLKDIQDGQILFKQLDEMVVEDRERALAYKVRPGDIILSSRGTAFKLAIVPEHEGEILLSNMFLGIRVIDPQKTYPRYIQSFFESPIGIQYLELYQSGSMVTVLSYKDVEKIIIPDLPYGKQVEIADGVAQAEVEYLQMLEEAKRVYRDKVKNQYKKMTIADSIEGF